MWGFQKSFCKVTKKIEGVPGHDGREGVDQGGQEADGAGGGEGG